MKGRTAKLRDRLEALPDTWRFRLPNVAAFGAMPEQRKTQDHETQAA